MAKMWNPWRGCHKTGEGCKNCYIFAGDSRKGIDTNEIQKTESFSLPIERKKNGMYKIPDGELVYVCFSSDFLLEEADEWRKECFSMMKERSDLQFLFLTKRIKRFLSVAPGDWGEGYHNVTIGVSISTQREVDEILPEFMSLNVKYKNIILQPLIEPVNLRSYLKDVELVVLGGEYGSKARPLNFDWVLEVREQCIEAGVAFEFRQCGTFFVKEGREYQLSYRELTLQAKKASIDWYPSNE